MKKILCMLLVILLLAGCGTEEPEIPVGNEVWEALPQLTYGQWESEKLGVLNWDSGRCAFTSRNRMAETEAGLYFLRSQDSNLFYADKVKPATWVRVCNAPNCIHGSTLTCSAMLRGSTFVFREGRIYYLTSASAHRELYPDTERDGAILVSMAHNGSDLRLEYVLEDAMHTGGGGSRSEKLTSDYWLYSCAKLRNDGQYDMFAFLVNENGGHLLGQKRVEEEEFAIVSSANGRLGLMGEDAWLNTVLSSDGTFYRVVGDTLEPVDLSGLDVVGGYLSGNVVRIFRPNDGYYDVDLTTRQETRLAEAHLENSYCQIILPNCVVEGTLLGAPSRENRTEGMTHSLAVFDGEGWHDVELPEELKNARKNDFIFVLAVTSDSILFGVSGSNELKHYRIPLGTGLWTLEPVE